MARLLTLIAIVTLIALPVPAHAQPPGPTPTPRPVTCVAIFQGSGGWQQHTINVPSWATGLKLQVVWSGLQLRWWIDDTVWGLGAYGQTEVWTTGGVDNPPIGGWGGTRVVEITGILVDSIGEWTIYACGSAPPPPPTPTPLPTATPHQGPGCVSRVGEPAVPVTDTLTLYGPASGWYIISVMEAPGSSRVRWRLARSGLIGSSEVEYTGNATVELRSGDVATITVLSVGGGGFPTVVIPTPPPPPNHGSHPAPPNFPPSIPTPQPTPTPGDGGGSGGGQGSHPHPHAPLRVIVDAVCAGLELTPISPAVNDIKPVEFGIADEGTDCPISLPRVRFTFSPPGLPSVSLDFPGVRICLLYRRLTLAWGEFNAMDWAIPLLSLSVVWAAWLSLRRG